MKIPLTVNCKYYVVNLVYKYGMVLLGSVIKGHSFIISLSEHSPFLHAIVIYISIELPIPHFRSLVKNQIL